MEMGNDADHETPPIIPRYDTGPPQLQVNSRRLIRASPASQMSFPYGVQNERKKVLMIRRPDGSTQLLRPVTHRESMAPRLLQRMPATGMHSGMLTSGSTIRSISGGQFRTSTLQQHTPRSLFEDSYISHADGGVYSNNRIANLRPQISFAQRMSGIRRYGFPQTLQSSIRNPSPLREYIPRRTTYDRFSRRLINRNLQFDFEGNVAEERAIRDAIAKEEEKMLLEEENRLPTKGVFSNSVLDFTPASLSQGAAVEDSVPFCRNLLPSTDDTADERTIKLVLENIVNQVCRWDKHYGWYKMHLNKPKYKMARKVYLKHNEIMLSEHLDYLRKEINKRRSQLETQAETSLGMLAPWRRARGRPSNKQIEQNFASVEEDSKDSGYASGKDSPLKVIELEEPSDEEYERGQFAPFNKFILEDDEDSRSECEDISLKDLLNSNYSLDLMAVSPSNPYLGELHIEIPVWKQPEEPTPQLILLTPKKRLLECKQDDEPIAKRLRSKLPNPLRDSDDFTKRPLPTDKDKQRHREHQREQQAMNPADISLGGDSVDWADKDVKEEDSSHRQPSPKRMRRESSKQESSDDDDDEQQGKVLMHIPPPLARSRGRPRKAESERRRREAEARMKKMVEEGNDVRNMIDPSELHCICRQPFDDRKFYVACSQCQQWFHGKCIGLSEKRARRLSRFVCHDCRSPQDEESEEIDDAGRGEVKHDPGSHPDEMTEDEDQEEEVEVDVLNDQQMTEGQEHFEISDIQPKDELFCLCRTPYNEEKFYVGCDSCTGWYHPECVGITERDAQQIESYLCPSCQSHMEQQQHSNQQFERHSSRNSFLWGLFEAVSEHRNAWPFKETVDVDEFPNYHQIVKNPIDLSIIENRLRSQCYSSHIDLHADLQLMVSNAKLFNQKGSAIYQCAEAIEAVIKSKIAEARKRSTH
ncbi:unnamed protein product, partial [Mesorhabditis belari]|uniref:Uncharacterized protein n=1 Tax=Mesorhabditis belari TaxID=2138241 RepID=A0AAF3EWG4_9BILA